MNIPCTSCRYARVEILVLPCQHLALCCRCAADVVHCPVCHKEVKQKLQVYVTEDFAGPQSLTPPEVLEEEEEEVKAVAPQKILALTNGEEFHEALLMDAEAYLRMMVPLEHMTLSNGMKILGTKIPKCARQKLIKGDRIGYYNEVLNAVHSTWRAFALRYHPDKAGDAWWQHDQRIDKLVKCFKFLQNVVEVVERGYAKFIVPTVKNAAVNYSVADENLLCVTLTWKAVEALGTIITFADASGVCVEIEVAPGKGNEVFYEDDYPYVFDDFDGFKMAHIYTCGKCVGTTGYCTNLVVRVPDSVRHSQAALRRHATLERLGRLQQELKNLTRKEPVQICFAHDVSNNKHCRKWRCTRLHLNTRLREDSLRFQWAKRSFIENNSGHSKRRKF